MNKRTQLIVVIFFLINSVSIWIYWSNYIRDFKSNTLLFSDHLTSYMFTHILSEYTVGLVTLVAVVLFFRKSTSFQMIWYFALGMHFYAAMQATGWAFSNGLYPVFIIFIINMALALFYLTISIRSHYQKNS